IWRSRGFRRERFRIRTIPTAPSGNFTTCCPEKASLATRTERRRSKPVTRLFFNQNNRTLSDLYPYHTHSAQWEFYYVLSGKGVARHKDGTTAIETGDAFIFQPEQPHTFRSVSVPYPQRPVGILLRAVRKRRRSPQGRYDGDRNR